MLKITGRISDAQADRICRAVAWFFKTNGVKQPDISIEVSLKYQDDNGRLYADGKRYNVWINKALSAEQTLHTLFHELQHIVQFVKKMLSVSGIWEFWHGVCTNNTPYYHRPQEIDARQVAHRMLGAYWKLAFV